MIRWWKLKNNEVREFRRSVVERMANAHEVTTENVEEWWEETAGVDQVLWRGSMREVIWEEETGTGELVVERRDREGGEGKGGQTKDVETNWRR